jgi:hypothetical protein
MAYVSQLKVKTRVIVGPLNGTRGRWTFVQAVLALSLIFFGAASISAQDLGALAREERARKQAEPPMKSMSTPMMIWPVPKSLPPKTIPKSETSK